MQLLDAVAQLAPGIPKHQLVRWALDLIKQQGFAESYREQVSMDFMLIQAVDVTAFVIQVSPRPLPMNERRHTAVMILAMVVMLMPRSAGAEGLAGIR